MIKLKRAYAKPAKDDGERILVERLWPRGLTKLHARIDLWLKDVAPSTELRRIESHNRSLIGDTSSSISIETIGARLIEFFGIEPRLLVVVLFENRSEVHDAHPVPM